MDCAGGEIRATELGTDLETLHAAGLRVEPVERRRRASCRQSKHMEGDADEHESDRRCGRCSVR